MLLENMKDFAFKLANSETGDANRLWLVAHIFQLYLKFIWKIYLSLIKHKIPANNINLSLEFPFWKDMVMVFGWSEHQINEIQVFTVISDFFQDYTFVMPPVVHLTSTIKRFHIIYQHSHSNFLGQWIKESLLTWRGVGLGVKTMMENFVFSTINLLTLLP